MPNRARVQRNKETCLFKVEEIARLIFPEADTYVRLESNESPIRLYKHYGVEVMWGFCQDTRTMYFRSPVNHVIVNLGKFVEGLPV